MKNRLFILIIIVVLFFSFGCCKNKKLNNKRLECQDLMSNMSDGIKEINKDKILMAFPDSMKEKLNKIINENEIKEYLKKYGDNIKFSFNIISLEEQSKEWVNYLNEKNSILYNKDLKINNCYEIKGTYNIIGKKNETIENIIDTYYCNFDGDYKLLLDI